MLLPNDGQYDPEEETAKASHKAHGAQNNGPVVVLFHGLQIPGAFLLLGVEGKEDGRDGAAETNPTGTPEHHATGYDGVDKAVIACAIAACVDSRGRCRLLRHNHSGSMMAAMFSRLRSRLVASRRLVGRRLVTSLLRGVRTIACVRISHLDLLQHSSSGCQFSLINIFYACVADIAQSCMHVAARDPGVVIPRRTDCRGHQLSMLYRSVLSPLGGH